MTSCVNVTLNVVNLAKAEFFLSTQGLMGVITLVRLQKEKKVGQKDCLYLNVMISIRTFGIILKIFSGEKD